MTERRNWLTPGAAAPAAPTGSRRTRGDWYLLLLSLVLLGYALFGKGFAYFGAPPVYIGEIALAMGLVALLLSRGWGGVFDLLPAKLLVVFMAYGALRTLPYVGTYGFDALRDAVIWGYGVFAVIVAGLLIARPARLARMIGGYRTFAVIFPLLIIFIMVGTRLVGDAIPVWPSVGVPIVLVKSHDTLVHIAGILAFTIGGLGPARGTLWVPVQMLVLVAAAFLPATGSRGGTLAFLAATGVAVLLKPGSRAIWRFAGIGLFILLALALADVRFTLPGSTRESSVLQVLENMQSIVSDTGGASLQATKSWRLAWWGNIYEYTFDGDFFWGGKGYGINLADSDGFQVAGEGAPPLRSPHNGHLTILARSGVPGLLLWLGLHGAWTVSILLGYRRSRRAGDRRWAGLFLFLLAYWFAFMINGSFDVFLEGPMGGIWFWTVFGVGLAALRIYRKTPEVLEAI